MVQLPEGLEHLARLVEQGTLALRDALRLVHDISPDDRAALAAALLARGIFVPPPAAAAGEAPAVPGAGAETAAPRAPEPGAEPEAELVGPPTPVRPRPDALPYGTQNLDPHALRRAETLVLRLPAAPPSAWKDGEGLPLTPGGGRYVIRHELARGGMGSIRLAEDRDLGRQVALKSIHPQLLSDPATTARFVREARLTGQLQHPGIVPVHDLGQLAQGEPFYTMLLVRGKNLAEIFEGLRQGDPEFLRRFSRMRLLGILQQLSRAVGFAHASGVVHRDLKPANIMVGDHGEVYVMDWGIARVLHDSGSERFPTPDLRPLPGEDDELAGTPFYMSPEQARRDAEAVGPQSDVYALGAMLYEALTLRPPFDAVDLETLLHKVCHEPPIPFEQRAPEADVSPTLQAICLKALHKDPAARYPHADAFADELLSEIEGVKQAERRVAMAAEEWQRARRALERHARLESARIAVVRELARLRRTTPSWCSPAEREALAAERSRLDLVEVALARAFSEATSRLTTVHRLDPRQAEARAELERLYRDKYRAIYQTSDYANILYYGTRLQELRQSSSRDATAWLSVRSAPPGADVYLLTYGALDLATDPGPEQYVGAAPIRELALPPGGYVVLARHPGFEDRIQALILEPGAHEHALLVLAPLRGQGPMVGRNDAAHRLRQAVDDSVVDGRQNVFVVTGGRGVGTSRLLNDLTESLVAHPDVFVFVRFLCERRFRHVPYAAARAVLRQRFGLAPEDPPAVARAVIAQMQGNVGNLTRRARFDDADRARLVAAGTALEAIPGLLADGPPRTSAEAAREAFGTFFASLTRYLPVVIVVEDAQWLDDTSQDLLGAALAATRNAPLLVVLGLSAAGPRLPATLATLVATAHTLALRPFSPADTARCLAGLLDAPPDSDAVMRIQAATGGVPRWVQEACRVAGRRGWLTRRGGNWLLSADVRPADLAPFALTRQVLAARTEAEQQVLLAAAIAGQPFSAVELQALGVSDPQPGLRLLAADGLIVPSLGSAGRFGFAFRELPAVVRAEIPQGERRARHAVLADHWAARPATDPLRDALVAYHSARAGAPHRAAEAAAAMAERCSAVEAPVEARWWQRRAAVLRSRPR